MTANTAGSENGDSRYTGEGHPMMRIQLSAILTLLLFGASLPSHAALYQFTVGGEVTMSSHGGVNVSDPVTITYVANSQDHFPSPTSGAYVATRATFTFPNATLESDGFAEVRVVLNDTDGHDRVRYTDAFFQSPLVLVDITFPVGTLTSDALPTALPLPAADSASFHYSYYDGTVRGNVLSFASAEVPEPSVLLAFLMVTPMLAATRTRR